MKPKDILRFLLRGGRTFGSNPAQQRWLLRVFALLSFPVIAGLAAFHFVLGYHFLVGVQGACALALPVIYMLLGRLQWLRPLEIACIAITALLLITVIIDGGVANTALYWLPVFPFIAFFISGLRRGWYWIAGLGLTILAISVLMQRGILASPYQPFELNISLVIYLFYTALAALFEGLRERQQDGMDEANQELAQLTVQLTHAREHLEDEVATRTASLKESNARLRREIREHEEAKEALAESERRYLQAQKMEAIGTLVGGIAHDFNNMLSGINANLFLIRKRCSDNPDTVKQINNISTLSSHAAEMIRQLLTFARKDAVEYSRFDAAPFINEAAKLGRMSVPSEIRFSTDIDRAPSWIDGNATQLQQVLFNLIGNARDALEGVEEPSIRVELNRVEAEEELLRRHPELSPRPYLRLTVRDNGAGIAPEIRDKIFEPFFTTKGSEKGTGLGLAMCYGAAQRHGGTIEVESEPGKETSMHFYLPLLERPSSQPGDENTDENAPMPTTDTTILIVDDEEPVRSAQRTILEELGFKVLEAEEGQQALEQLHANRDEIGLVLMDLKMPGMNGVETVEKMRPLYPDLPVVFLTAFHEEYREAISQLPDAHTVLEKPVNVQKLSEAIRQQLPSRR